MELARLRHGASVSGDSGNSMNHLPPWMDKKRFKRGQQFFVNHCSGIIFGLHCSLTVGFTIVPLLDSLVFTKASDTTSKAFRRYIETLVHIVLWHTTDVWDCETPSTGFQSLACVRRVHNRVAEAMNRASNRRKLDTDDCSLLPADGTDVYISQYDMAVVQSGFIGTVIMHPESFGIFNPSRCDLEDYVFFWRGIGYLLGIDDEYNICSGGLDTALEICMSIENELVLPGLYRPPSDFHRMTDAYIGGINSLAGGWVKTTSKEFTVAYSIYTMKGQASELPLWLKLAWSDQLHFYTTSALTFLKKWIPGFNRVVNWFWLNVVFRGFLPLVEKQLAKRNSDQVDVSYH